MQTLFVVTAPLGMIGMTMTGCWEDISNVPLATMLILAWTNMGQIFGKCVIRRPKNMRRFTAEAMTLLDRIAPIWGFRTDTTKLE
jgi:hypothetical protein